MKKIILLLLLTISTFLHAQPSQTIKKFIKGNIQDKTEAIKESSDKDAIELSGKGLAFVIENSQFFSDDRDFSTLVIASILKLPKDKDVLTAYFPTLNSDLIKIFNIFSDENVRISVLDKLELTSSLNNSNEITELLNSYLKNSKEMNKNSPVTKKIFSCIEKSGNTESFGIVYESWKKNYYSEYKNDVENALIVLSSKNFSETIKVISTSSIREIRDFFNLINKSDKVSNEFKAEIAENALSMAIHNTEDISKDMNESVELQLNSLKTIADCNWTRATGLTVRYFALAKEEYEKNVLLKEQFIQVIESITKLSSSQTALALSSYLAEINSKTESNIPFEQSVVISVINSLGVLGDKAAFDNLLYVTYLNYSDDIKNKARESLAKLKW